MLEVGQTCRETEISFQQQQYKSFCLDFSWALTAMVIEKKVHRYYLLNEQFDAKGKFTFLNNDLDKRR